MIPYLTTWTATDLIEIRGFIEQDAAKCPNVAWRHETSRREDKCIVCDGSGTTHGHTQGIAIDWLLEKLGRVQPCERCSGSGKTCGGKLDYCSVGEVHYCPACHGSGGDRLPEMGVDSQMTEMCLLAAQLTNPLPSREELGDAEWLMTTMPPIFPLPWLLRFGEIVARPAEAVKCEACGGTGDYANEKAAHRMAHRNRHSGTSADTGVPVSGRGPGPYDSGGMPDGSGSDARLPMGIDSLRNPLMRCVNCKGSGKFVGVSHDRDRIERLRTWRTSYYSGDPAFANGWWVHIDGRELGSSEYATPYQSEAEADRELRRRVLAEFGDCGRTVECPCCTGICDPKHCEGCEGDGTRIVKPGGVSVPCSAEQGELKEFPASHLAATMQARLG